MVDFKVQKVEVDRRVVTAEVFANYPSLVAQAKVLISMRQSRALQTTMVA